METTKSNRLLLREEVLLVALYHFIAVTSASRVYLQCEVFSKQMIFSCLEGINSNKFLIKTEYFNERKIHSWLAGIFAKNINF